MENEQKKIKEETDFLASNNNYLFFKTNESAIRFSPNKEEKAGEVIFSSHSTPWGREEMRSLIEFLDIEKIYLPHGMCIKSEEVIQPLQQPYLLQLKTINHNYKNKLFFLLKTKNGFTFSRYRILRNQHYIAFTKVNGANLDFYTCDSFSNELREFKDFIPMFTSNKLAKSFFEKQGEKIKEYQPMLINYKRVEKKAMGGHKNICINPNSPIIKNKDFAYFIDHRLIKELH